MVELLIGLLISSTIAYLLVIWYNTDAVVEYIKLLGLSRLFKIDDYEQLTLGQGEDFTYPEYLVFRYDCFFTRLLSCPICLGFWLSFISCAIGGKYLHTFSIAFVSVLLYTVLKKIL